MPRAGGQDETVSERQGVVLTARVHPGESNSSWMMEGVLDFLTSESHHAKVSPPQLSQLTRLLPDSPPCGVHAVVGQHPTVESIGLYSRNCFMHTYVNMPGHLALTVMW